MYELNLQTAFCFFIIFFLCKSVRDCTRCLNIFSLLLKKKNHCIFMKEIFCGIMNALSSYSVHICGHYALTEK